MAADAPTPCVAGHQQPWYGQLMKQLFSLEKYFNYLLQINAEQWYKT